MLQTRVLPCLLLQNGSLVKTTRFTNPHYIGDPLNAVRIFNEKEVDELIILDIRATTDNKGPAFEVLRDIANECFMPMCYGGGIRSIEDAKTIFAIGVEKVALNTAIAKDPGIVTSFAKQFGSQSIVASLDVKKTPSGYQVFTHQGSRPLGVDVITYAQKVEALGAGEILLTSIDRDGTMDGYDLEMIAQVTSRVRVPVIASGGAGSLADIQAAVSRANASAAALGSMAVYHGRNKAVLIGFPKRADLEKLWGEAP